MGQVPHAKKLNGNFARNVQKVLLQQAQFKVNRVLQLH